MNKRRLIITVLLASAVWGLCEALLGEYLYRDMSFTPPIPRGVLLSVIGVCVLAVARRVAPLPGSSLAIGVLAACYKGLNTNYACHLLAIACLAGGFDLAASVVRRRYEKHLLWRSLAGAGGTLVGFWAFGMLITFAIQYHYWYPVTWEKFGNYMLVQAAMTALAAALLVPLADGATRRVMQADLRTGSPAWAKTLTAASAIGLWVFALLQPLVA